MNTREAKQYVNTSSTIEREPQTWIFTQETYKKTSMKQFVQALNLLEGWICDQEEGWHYPNPVYHPNYKIRYYKTVAAIPGAV